MSVVSIHDLLRRERDLLVLVVVEFGDVPAIIVTVFSASSDRR